MGWVSGVQDWKGGANPHAAHDHRAMAAAEPAGPPPLASLEYIVLRARTEHMPAPAIIQPPGAPNAFGPPNGNVWTLTTLTQNRPQVRKISYDPETSLEVARSGFADKHAIDRAIGYGIAWHEGQLLRPRQPADRRRHRARVVHPCDLGLPDVAPPQTRRRAWGATRRARSAKLKGIAALILVLAALAAVARRLADPPLDRRAPRAAALAARCTLAGRCGEDPGAPIGCTWPASSTCSPF